MAKINKNYRGIAWRLRTKTEKKQNQLACTPLSAWTK
jgi:hypothetical protein